MLSLPIPENRSATDRGAPEGTGKGRVAMQPTHRASAHARSSRLDRGRGLPRDVVRDRDDAGHSARDALGQLFERWPAQTRGAGGDGVGRIPATDFALVAELPLLVPNARDAVLVENGEALERTCLGQDRLDDLGGGADNLDALRRDLADDASGERRAKERRSGVRTLGQAERLGD